MYNKGLRSTEGVSYGSIDFFRSYCQVLDYGLVTIVQSFFGREKEENAFHQKFLLPFKNYRHLVFGIFVMAPSIGREKKSRILEI